MHDSETIGWMLTALCVFVAGVCLQRARDARGMLRRTARTEALMGLGMAAMALPGSVTGAVPTLGLTVFFGVFFAAVAAREVTLLRRAGPGQQHSAHHIVGALAMVYADVAMPAAHGSAVTGNGEHAGVGAAAAGLPLLTGTLLAYFALYVLRTGLRLLPSGARTAGHGTSLAPAGSGVGVDNWNGTGTGNGSAHQYGGAAEDLPGLAASCRVAMGTGMLAMLLML